MKRYDIAIDLLKEALVKEECRLMHYKEVVPLWRDIWIERKIAEGKLEQKDTKVRAERCTKLLKKYYTSIAREA